MLGFTPEQQIKLTIQQGSIFYFVEETWKSDEPHYFIVLNPSPQKDVLLIMVGATTLCAKDFSRITGLPKETFVDVTPDECQTLKKISLFNCNNVIEKSIDTLVKKLEKEELKRCGYVEMPILTRLLNGVKMSPNVKGQTKKMLE